MYCLIVSVGSSYFIVLTPLIHNFTCLIADEPSTPRSTHNVQDNVVDAESVPQAGSYQPTPPGSKFWIPEAKKKPVEGTEFDTIEQAFLFYKEYAREGGFEVRRGGQSNRKKNKILI